MATLLPPPKRVKVYHGVPEPEAEKRAWATVNKMDNGGKVSGSGRGKPVSKAPARKGGKKGGTASAAGSSLNPSRRAGQQKRVQP